MENFFLRVSDQVDASEEVAALVPYNQSMSAYSDTAQDLDKPKLSPSPRQTMSLSSTTYESVEQSPNGTASALQLQVVDVQTEIGQRIESDELVTCW